ncbi:hypothetical protein CDD82_5798 [Ophiocordyceps australis]|uniref:60S ribosomal protein L6 n=1 Tax=Ophiocordyceps australis TaxID=1399860 RepID=A0A2C5YZL0_9HYPO|nr:hypothetical protein CDD82_5798 [Ophiocordyceps australis]
MLLSPISPSSTPAYFLLAPSLLPAPFLAPSTSFFLPDPDPLLLRPAEYYPLLYTACYSRRRKSRAYCPQYRRLVRKAIRPWAPRKTLQPGTVLILLAGRFRGKRVVLVKALDQGVLLVTGPFKINGVPLRRVNSRYVIATSYKIDISGLDTKKIDEICQPKYFTADKTKQKAGEEAFFKQGEKPQKKHISSSRAADQKAVDKPLLASIKKVDMLASYLGSSFSLRKGDKPHEMKW